MRLLRWCRTRDNRDGRRWAARSPARRDVCSAAPRRRRIRQLARGGYERRPGKISRKSRRVARRRLIDADRHLAVALALLAITAALTAAATRESADPEDSSQEAPFPRSSWRTPGVSPDGQILPYKPIDLGPRPIRPPLDLFPRDPIRPPSDDPPGDDSPPAGDPGDGDTGGGPSGPGGIDSNPVPISPSVVGPNRSPSALQPTGRAQESTDTPVREPRASVPRAPRGPARRLERDSGKE